MSSFVSPQIFLVSTHLFGEIAASNALSDLYAMGADGLLSLSFQGVPTEVPAEVVTEIARGDAAKMSGAPVVGGHRVESKDLLFGLAAFGLAHPGRSDS